MKWERRVEIINGVPFTSYEPVPDHGAPPNFDGGARALPLRPPRVEWTQDEGGWQTATLEDGAALIFGDLGE